MEPELLQRIERLERQNRRMNIAGGALVLGVVAVFLLGQAKPAATDVIEATRFVLKDEKGVEQGSFFLESFLKGKRPVLQLGPPTGPSLKIHPDGLGIYQEAATALFRTSGIMFLRPRGPSASLHLSEDAAEFALTDSAANRRVLLAVYKHSFGGTSIDTAHLNVTSSRVEDPWVGITEDAISIFGRDSKPRAVVGRASLERTATGATETTASSSLVLFDKDGNVIFREPR